MVDDATRLEPREDARLVEALRAERPEAFNELVGSYQNAVYNLAYRLVRDREDARDVAQDVFLKAFKRIPQIEGDLHLWAWLYRVTVNTCWDHLRAAGRRPALMADADEIEGESPADEGERREIARLFSDSLSRLSPRQQAALVLKDVHGLTHTDIADTLGISRASSEILLFRARHSFRRVYSALVAEEDQAFMCRYAEQSAADAVGGRLSAAQRRRVLEHARSCEPCGKVVATWRRNERAGLALALPLVAAPHLFGSHAGFTTVAGLAGAKGGAAAGGGVMGGGAAGGGAAASSAAAAAGAPLLGAGASSGVVMSAAGGVAAKLAGLGVAKAAAVVLVAASVATYGGVQAGKIVGGAPAAPAPVVAALATPKAAAPAAAPLPLSTSTGVVEAAEAPADEAAQIAAALRARLRLLRTAAVLTGDPELTAQVGQLSVLLAAGGGLAGADALRGWNRVTRSAMRMLRAIGDWGPAGLGRADSLAALVRGTQTRLDLAAAQGSLAGGSNAGAAGVTTVTRATTGGGAASPTGVAAEPKVRSSHEPPASTVDPAGELGGIRDATPSGGSSGGGSTGQLDSVKPKKPPVPVTPSGSTKPQGATKAE